MKVNSFFQENMCVKTKLLFAHSNTSLLHTCFGVVKDKKDSATAGHFKIDKLTSSVNCKRNTTLYHGTIIRTYYSSMVIYTGHENKQR